mgnify:CR=1 FL=1
MDQKTEKPTPKKISDARKKGQVAQSKEVVSAALLTSLFLYFWATDEYHLRVLSEIILLPAQFYHLPFYEALEGVVEGVLHKVFFLLIPLITIVVVVGILSNYIQVGPLFVMEPIKPKAEKISLISGFKKIFSMKNFFEFVKSVFKILFLSFLVYLVIINNIKDLIEVPYCGDQCLMPLLGYLVKLLLINSVIAFIVVAVIDYVFQKMQHIKQLKMSMDEIKREYKETEGNPEIKSQRKSIHRELLNGDTRKKVAGSSVLITNPTHVAVGLYYKKGDTPLPSLTVMGVDSMAQRIKAIAYEENIPVIENIPLARALLAQAEVGGAIPSNLIEPVAEVFSWLERVGVENSE